MPLILLFYSMLMFKKIKKFSLGWMDVKRIVVSVVVGFLYMSISMFVFLLTIVRSRKLMWPLDSSVGVNCRLVCIVLVYCVRKS